MHREFELFHSVLKSALFVVLGCGKDNQMQKVCACCSYIVVESILGHLGEAGQHKSLSQRRMSLCSIHSLPPRLQHLVGRHHNVALVILEKGVNGRLIQMQFQPEFLHLENIWNVLRDAQQVFLSDSAFLKTNGESEQCTPDMYIHCLAGERKNKTQVGHSMSITQA